MRGNRIESEAISRDNIYSDLVALLQRADAEEGRIEPLFIKEERPEEDGDLLGELTNRKDRFVESGLDGMGQAPSVDRQTRPSIWEVSGPETARKTKRQRDRGKTLQPSAPEQSAARLNSPCPEYLLCERSSQLRTLFSQGGGETEAGDPSCSYAAEANSESLSFHSELQSGPPAGKGAGSSLSVGSLDVKPEVVMIDSVPTEEEAEMHSVWSEEAVSGNVPAQHRLYREERDRMEIIPGNVDMCPPYAQIPVRDNTAGPHFMAPDINAFVPFDRNLSLPKGLGTLMARKKERLFSCTYCGKAFNRPKKVEIHQRIHTGEKPFACTFCDKRFADSGNLKKHLRVHTGEKPFRCTSCGRTFASIQNLKTHQQRNHPASCGGK
ncbi:hypothetical protein JZ751_016378 [Albula glossodonta]|uniref:C2H2-type domain-containing protein n=1 Tax=Albula glossodonta TaxID=121402 RepID=A0A8T2NNH4_9TELE|nr:hypothetical protein JZ751_016378 [Albula glossodonta]